MIQLIDFQQNLVQAVLVQIEVLLYFQYIQ